MEFYRDSVFRAVDLTSQAIPTLVEGHVRFPGLRVDRQTVDRTGVDTDPALVMHLLRSTTTGTSNLRVVCALPTGWPAAALAALTISQFTHGG